MRRNLLDSPIALVLLTCSGWALCSLSFVGLGRHRGSHALGTVLVELGLMLAGTFCLYWSPYTLRDGVRNDRWPDAAVDPLRQVVDHVAWRWLIAALVVTMLIVMIVKWRQSLYFWEVFFLLQAVTQLSSAFARPRQKPGSWARVDWTKIPPLHSDHWGER